MRRLAIFAHFDARGEVKRYVLFHLKALREVCDTVWFVSTAALPPSELSKARAFSDRAWTRDNVGYDFGTWREALEATSLSDWNEIVLTNSSVFGPLWSLREAFGKMENQPLDLWGMTDNVSDGWHLQSYFLVARESFLRSPMFAEFWASVTPAPTKRTLIVNYEVGLSRAVIRAELRAAAFVPIKSLPPAPWRYRIRGPQFANPTLLQPLELLERRMPYVKVQLLRDNPRHRRLGPVRKVMAGAGYDMGLIEIDPVETGHRGGSAK